MQNPAAVLSAVRSKRAPAVRGAWWAVVSRFLVHGLVTSTWVSRIPALKSSLRLSDGALGVSLLGTAIGSLIAIPCCGWIVDRVGSRRACVWTTAALCLALMLPAVTVSAATLFAALLIFGAAASSNDVAMNAQAVAVEKRLGSRTMSRFHAMFSIGGIIGASTGGVVASYGVTPLRHFAAAALVLLAFSTLTSPLLMEVAPAQAVATRPAARRLRISAFPFALMVLSAIGFCIYLSEGAIADWSAVYLRQVLHSSQGGAAAGYAVFSASMAVFRLCGDAITNRLGPTRTIRAGGVLAALGLASSLAAPSVLWAMPGFALAGAGFSSIIPLVFAAGGRIRGLGEGAGIAAVSGVGYIGFLAGPPIIGGLSELASLRAGLLFVVALTALSAVLIGVVRRNSPELLG